MPPRPLLCCGLQRLSRRTRLFIWYFIVCAVLCGATTAVFLVAGIRRWDIRKLIDDGAQGKDGVALLGHAYNVDAAARQVQMSWLVLGCGSLALSDYRYYSSQQCGRPNIAVDLYVDGATNATGSYDPAADLWFEVQSRKNFYIQASVEIQTEHLLEVTAWFGQDQQYAYPFDTYHLDTFFRALTPDSGIDVPILFLRIADATNNFWAVPNKDADVMTLPIDNSTTTLARAARFEFQRPQLSRLFVIVLFVVNWLLTAVVVYIAVSAWEGLVMSEGVLVLPVSVILTIPALRALWVDAPAFGLLLDSCGTFFQMVIVSLASLYLVVNVGLRRRKQAAQQAWDEERTRERERAKAVESGAPVHHDIDAMDLEKDGASRSGSPLLPEPLLYTRG